MRVRIWSIVNDCSELIECASETHTHAELSVTISECCFFFNSSANVILVYISEGNGSMGFEKVFKRVIVFILLIMVIMTGVSLMFFGVLENRISNSPTIDIDRAGTGNHIKVTPTRVLEVFDKSEEIRLSKHSPKKRIETTYYSVVEIKEKEGACIIMTSSTYPSNDSLSGELEGLAVVQPTERFEKAQQAMKAHGDLTLYNISVDQFTGDWTQFIMGAVIAVIGIVSLVCAIVAIRKH